MKPVELIARDGHFAVEVISQTPNPQQAIYAAMHQDYCEDFVFHGKDEWPSEERCGEIIVNKLLRGGRGHYGPLEHPQIVFNVGWFPHSTMQQLRTHRIASFDVQSFRYTGQRLIDVYDGIRSVEEVFYLRPIGEYTDRQGKRYEYDELQRQFDIDYCWAACDRYRNRVVKAGFSEEHARGLIPFDVRQHWVMSCNARSLMHILTLRGKADAQLEAQAMCELVLPHFQSWVPALYEWFMETLWKKGKPAA